MVLRAVVVLSVVFGASLTHAGDAGLPVGSAPEPLAFPHFPSRLHRWSGGTGSLSSLPDWPRFWGRRGADRPPGGVHGFAARGPSVSGSVRRSSRSCVGTGISCPMSNC